MNATPWINAIAPLALSVTVGIIGFFLKRTIALVDKHESDIVEKSRMVQSVNTPKLRFSHIFDSHLNISYS
ncbi:hypothetical protein [Ethanoligenens sp.]|uniref:hypothetical protein n=1 Tax=Ethanoligenens sp. TaxID=2099655 RepID=UPI0039EA09BD